MRKWRVGTVSMGASLILLGCFLFISQVKGFEVLNTLIAWWPLVLVVLGLEVLCFVFFSKKEHPVVKYDIFSILFVGFLGFLSIGFVLLTVTGLMGEVRHIVSAEERTMELPVIEEKLPTEVERIVLQLNGQHVSIEGTNEWEWHLFGTYNTVTSEEREQPGLKDEDVLAIQKAGNTLYVTIKPLPQKMGLFYDDPVSNLTVVLPQNVQVEVKGRDGFLELNPGELKNNWIVQNSDDVTVNLLGNSDIELSAVTRDNVLQGNAEWTSLTDVRRSHARDSGAGEAVDRDGEYAYEEDMYRGTIKVGKGSNQVNILESNGLTVNVLNE